MVSERRAPAACGAPADPRRRRVREQSGKGGDKRGGAGASAEEGAVASAPAADGGATPDDHAAVWLHSTSPAERRILEAFGDYKRGARPLPRRRRRPPTCAHGSPGRAPHRVEHGVMHDAYSRVGRRPARTAGGSRLTAAAQLRIYGACALFFTLLAIFEFCIRRGRWARDGGDETIHRDPAAMAVQQVLPLSPRDARGARPHAPQAKREFRDEHGR